LGFLRSLVTTRLMVTDGHHYLSLALQHQQDSAATAPRWIPLHSAAPPVRGSVDCAVPVT
jgi:hypothetical protein